MKVATIRKGIVLVLVFAAGVFALGCELIVDFDRTRIPIEGNDSSIDATTPPDAPTDTAVATDTGTDASSEAEASISDASDGGEDAADAEDSGDQ